MRIRIAHCLAAGCRARLPWLARPMVEISGSRCGDEGTVFFEGGSRALFTACSLSVLSWNLRKVALAEMSRRGDMQFSRADRFFIHHRFVRPRAVRRKGDHPLLCLRRSISRRRLVIKTSEESTGGDRLINCDNPRDFSKKNQVVAAAEPAPFLRESRAWAALCFSPVGGGCPWQIDLRSR